MKEDKLRSLQNQLDQYWKTTYADKLRREELERQKHVTYKKNVSKNTAVSSPSYQVV